MARFRAHHSTSGAGPVSRQIRVLGIDLAKQEFHLVGMDGWGTVVLRKRLYRSQLMAFITTLPPAVIGMEAWGGPTTGRVAFMTMGMRST
jgi:hypothetical protein